MNTTTPTLPPENQPLPSCRELAEMYIERDAARSKSENTIGNLKSAVSAYVKSNGPAPITRGGTQRMVDDMLAAGCQPQSINGYIGSLSRVCDWASEVEIIPKNPISKRVFSRLKTVEKVHRNVTDTMDFDAILSSVDSVRDKAILILMGVAGLRKSELCNLDKSDFTFPGRGQLLIRNPKNGKERFSFLSEEYADIIRFYVFSCQGAIFTASKTGKRLDPRSINYIVKKYGDFSPHKYRHRCAETLYQAGSTLEEISTHLGNSVAVTEKVYRGMDCKQQMFVADRLRPGGCDRGEAGPINLEPNAS